jgi:hypothetical protein
MGDQGSIGDRNEPGWFSENRKGDVFLDVPEPVVIHVEPGSEGTPPPENDD